MSRRLKRGLALLVLAMLGFAQANPVLAACPMHRVALAGMADHDCCDQSMNQNPCLAHNASDFQVAGGSSVLEVPAPAAVDIFVPFARVQLSAHAPPAAPPRRIPPRILLHSFLI